MKGVILGGGLESRLCPLTHAMNTYSLPIYNANGGPNTGTYLCLLPNGPHLDQHHLEYISQNRDADTVERRYRSNVFWAEKALGGTAAPSTPAQETVAQR